MPDITVHALPTGRVALRPNNVEGRGTPMLWWTFTAREWTDPLPIYAFAIEHPSGLVLWDAGQEVAAARPGYFPGGLVGAVCRRQLRPEQGEGETLTRAMDAEGLGISDVALVAISHLHFDHIGGLAEVPEVPVLVSAAELALARGKRPEMHGILTAHFDPHDERMRAVQFATSTDPELAAFEGAHDLFGDGSLVLLPTPGHSPGSMSLLVRRDNGAPLLLVGDVTYDPALLAQGVLPDVGDRAVAKRTAERIASLGRALPGLVVLAAHDPRVPGLLAG